ncbi:class I SAM-dependent methyltransferase [Polycladidibacter hongkongensis]|uniref:class I SAM-dependent methyltransferase n=1 Tax=Polycladidibacter hongkongensis TaxID=1647556 RepID=UPI00155E5D0A|nr:class I SAM-dependent methyltransferase [Pseudovibrio hongkongensis]
MGSGFFVDHCHFPHPPRLALMDASKDCLTFSATRLQRYRPSIHEHDILNPIQWEREGFDSISLGYLLHCLPGAMPEKSIVFKHLKPLMKPKGVLFGSTLLGREEQETWAARQLMDYYNRRGVFSNRDDNVDALKFELECNFGVFEVKRVGSAAFFWAKL